MERIEAYKTLRLDQSADGRMVENAYWTLVRQAQRRTVDESAAGAEIDRLNEAYTVLSPDAQGAPQTRRQASSAGSGMAFLDRFADWCAEEALRTRARWSHRNPEIAIIGGAALVMMLFAVGAGTSLAGVFLPMLLILIAIWAPWRRTE